MIDVCLAGTGGMKPLPDRFLTGLWAEHKGKALLIDCGEVKVGAMICYDREFPESARIMMLKGAELILVPNACPMEINRLSRRSPLVS